MTTPHNTQSEIPITPPSSNNPQPLQDAPVIAQSDTSELPTEYQLTEPIAEFYGELGDFFMVRLNEGRVQLRRVIKENREGGEL